MAEHPNAENVRRGFQAFAEGDVATMSEIIADNAVWHSAGRSRISGDYKGKQAILQFFGEIAQEAQIDQSLHAVLADDDHTVALVESTATRGDQVLESQIVFVFHIDDGQATEVWATALDQQATDEFWS